MCTRPTDAAARPAPPWAALRLLLAATLAALSGVAMGADPPAVEAGIVERTNALRQEHALAPLKPDLRLTQAAGDFAAFMARTGQYGHRAGGTTPAERAQRAGYAYCQIAENIGFQYSSAGFSTEALTTGFIQGWWGSPGHRRNMLEDGLTEIGVGVAHSADSGRWYAVQLFGRPESLRRSFSNASKTSGTVRGLASTVKRVRIPRVAWLDLLAVAIEIGIGIEIAHLTDVPRVLSIPIAIPIALLLPLPSDFVALTRSWEWSGNF